MVDNILLYKFSIMYLTISLFRDMGQQKTKKLISPLLKGQSWSNNSVMVAIYTENWKQTHFFHGTA